MPGLFLIAHAPLASALKLAAQHCFPEAAQAMQILDVPADMAPDEIEAQCRAILDHLQNSDPRGEALILADVFGATPCNIVQRLSDGAKVKVIAGVNVPMLWRALNYAGESLDPLIVRALAGGTQGVMQAGPNRPQHQSSQPRNDQDHCQNQQ